MKFYGLTILFSLVVKISLCQVVAIENGRENILRLCVDNYLTVVVEGIPSRDILLTTDNGFIERDLYRGEGRYIHHPKAEGRAIISIKKRVGNTFEDIATRDFRVMRMPIYPSLFAGKAKGKMSHLAIITQLGIAVGGDSHYDKRYPVSSYSVVVFRRGREIFKRKALGTVIDQVTNDFFYSLKNGDELRFEDIKVIDCDGELREATPIQIIVEDVVEYKNVNKNDTIFVEDPVTGEMVMKIAEKIWKKNKRNN